MDFAIVTINLTDLTPIEIFIEDIPKGEVGSYLLASSYLPIFKSEKLGGKTYLDGGFYDNLPFKILQKKGYEKLILVRTHARGLTRRAPNGEGITVISPSRDIGHSYICDRDQAKENIKMGYYDALKVFRALKGNIYYIKAKDEDYYMRLLLDLDKKDIRKILNRLNINLNPSKRVLFEKLVPKMGSLLGLKEDFSYEDLLIALLEKKAKDLGIKVYQIYDFEVLLKEVRTIEPFEKEEREKVNTIGKILEKVDLAKYFNKDESLLAIADIIFIR